VKKFPTIYAFLPHNDTITNIDERIANSILFPIGKGYKEIDFLRQIQKDFPSKVVNTSNLNLPYEIQEAKINSQYVIIDMYLNDEEVSFN
jgi:hypothetical protein